MRAVATCLFLLLLLLAGAGTAQAQVLPVPVCNPAPGNPLVYCKKVKIYNNEPVGGTTLYVVFARGKGRPSSSPKGAGDDWMIGLSQTTDPTVTYNTTQVYRYYVGCTGSGDSAVCAGILPQHFVEVTIPFYTQLINNANGKTDDSYADWWNGNRIFFYDDPAQVLKNYKGETPVPTPLPVGSQTPCVVFDGAGVCTGVTVFKSPVDLPAADRAQLMEYTFAAVDTNALPFKVTPQLVNYNISYVDQVYLPVAMAVFNNPIPYVGTIAKLADFRQKMNNFLSDYPQWPIYRMTDVTNPDLARPRIPGPAVIFSDLIPPQNTELFFPGASGSISRGDPMKPTIFPSAFPDPNTVITNMRDVLYPKCSEGRTQPPICVPYKSVSDFFMTNYNNYRNVLKCDTSLPATPEPNSFMQHLYGWVPYDNKCPNDLNKDPTFATVQDTYIHKLEYPFDANNLPISPLNPYAFNPYTRLVHSQTYLGMRAAYAFSIDDAFSFLQFIGDGLILTFGPGCNGLPKSPTSVSPAGCRSLNQNERVELTMGTVHGGVREWASATYACDGFNNSFTLDLVLGPVVEFYPQISPCPVTVKDLKGKAYNINVLRPLLQEGQDPTTNVAKDCTGVMPPEILGWCNRTNLADKKIKPTDKVIVGLSTPEVLPDNNTHDFNNDPCNDPPNFITCGRSDILWRNTLGGVAAWLMGKDGSGIIGLPVFGSLDFNAWTIVGQRDFNGDGFYDILWRNSAGGLGIWLINANLSSNPIIANPSVGTPPNDSEVVGTGDFNGDGKGDILFRNSTGQFAGVVFVWLITDATQNPVKTTQVVLPTKSVDWKVAGVGDFNGDGKSDIVWYNTVSRMVEIWLIDASNQANPVISMTVIATLPSPWIIAGTGDFDADGKSDILITSANADGTTNVGAWLMNGAALQPSPQTGSIQNPVGIGLLPAGWTIVETGDLNGDRRSDLILQFTDNTQKTVSTAVWWLDARRSGGPNPVILNTGVQGGIGSLPYPAWQIQTLNAN
jgi:hypothetical protein